MLGLGVLQADQQPVMEGRQGDAGCVRSQPEALPFCTLATCHKGEVVSRRLWRSEPEALPFCALAYALTGVISTALVALPPVANALLAITA